MMMMQEGQRYTRLSSWQFPHGDVFFDVKEVLTFLCQLWSQFALGFQSFLCFLLLAVEAVFGLENKLHLWWRRLAFWITCIHEDMKNYITNCINNVPFIGKQLLNVLKEGFLLSAFTWIENQVEEWLQTLGSHRTSLLTKGFEMTKSWRWPSNQRIDYVGKRVLSFTLSFFGSQSPLMSWVFVRVWWQGLSESRFCISKEVVFKSIAWIRTLKSIRRIFLVLHIFWLLLEPFSLVSVFGQIVDVLMVSVGVVQVVCSWRIVVTETILTKGECYMAYNYVKASKTQET